MKLSFKNETDKKSKISGTKMGSKILGTNFVFSLNFWDLKFLNFE